MIEAYREKKIKDTRYLADYALCEKIIKVGKEVLELRGQDIPITCEDGRGHEGFLDKIIAENRIK